MRHSVCAKLVRSADLRRLLGEDRRKWNAEPFQSIPCAVNRLGARHIECAEKGRNLVRVLKNRIRVSALDRPDVATAEREYPASLDAYFNLNPGVWQHAAMDHLR